MPTVRVPPEKRSEFDRLEFEEFYELFVRLSHWKQRVILIEMDIGIYLTLARAWLRKAWAWLG